MFGSFDDDDAFLFAVCPSVQKNGDERVDTWEREGEKKKNRKTRRD